MEPAAGLGAAFIRLWAPFQPYAKTLKPLAKPGVVCAMARLFAK